MNLKSVKSEIWFYDMAEFEEDRFHGYITTSFIKREANNDPMTHYLHLNLMKNFFGKISNIRFSDMILCSISDNIVSALITNILVVNPILVKRFSYHKKIIPRYNLYFKSHVIPTKSRYNYET